MLHVENVEKTPFEGFGVDRSQARSRDLRRLSRKARDVLALLHGSIVVQSLQPANASAL